MKINRNSGHCAGYLFLVFILPFFISSIKNHYFVLWKDYIAAEKVDVRGYFCKYIFEFWREYHSRFLLALLPVIVVNYLFVDILMNRTNINKKVFNFFVLTIGTLCFCEWCNFILHRGENLFQIASFSAFMLFTMFMECIAKVWKTTSCRSSAFSYYRKLRTRLRQLAMRRYP